MEQANKQEAKIINQQQKVLIVDDDAPTRILLRAAIAQWGYEVIEAQDGDQAWQLLQLPNAPQLIILDWLMPKLDGVTLCKYIKQKLTYSPYVILLTQVSGAVNIHKGLEAGADEFLSKPFNMAELQSRLTTGKRILEYKKILKMQQTLINEQIEALQQLVKETKTRLYTLSENVNTTTSDKKIPMQLIEINQSIEKMTDILLNLANHKGNE